MPGAVLSPSPQLPNVVLTMTLWLRWQSFPHLGRWRHWSSEGQSHSWPVCKVMGLCWRNRGGGCRVVVGLGFGLTMQAASKRFYAPLLYLPAWSNFYFLPLSWERNTGHRERSEAGAPPHDVHWGPRQQGAQISVWSQTSPPRCAPHALASQLRFRVVGLELLEFRKPTFPPNKVFEPIVLANSLVGNSKLSSNSFILDCQFP